jgi:hypothetical protein
MDTLTSAPPRINKDLIDLSRAQAIHATLPTRSEQGETGGEKGGRRPEMGEELGKGWTLCYHWDMGSVQDLGEDGTSRVSDFSKRLGNRSWRGRLCEEELWLLEIVVQRPTTLYPPNVGIRLVLLPPLHLEDQTPVDRGYFDRDYPDKQDRVQAEEGSGIRTSGKGL